LTLQIFHPIFPKRYKINTLALVGPVAQRLEQRTHNPLVPGSNPGGPTIWFHEFSIHRSVRVMSAFPVLNHRREDRRHPLSFSGYTQSCTQILGLTLDARRYHTGGEIELAKIHFTGVAFRWSRAMEFAPARSLTFTFHRSIWPFAMVESIK
jgi:hypothetical protein